MATEIGNAVFVLPDWYDERAAFETPLKGWFDGASVRLADGACYAVIFYDPVRLAQTLEDDAREGRPFFAEPNLIVLNEVTEENMRAAVDALARQGFFQHLKPLP
jgi:hypothetical protein